MPLSRTISRIVTVPPVGPGFGGPAHTAAAVISPGDFAATDPFFLMMDDRISVAGLFGDAHPHAGLARRSGGRLWPDGLSIGAISRRG